MVSLTIVTDRRCVLEKLLQPQDDTGLHRLPPNSSYSGSTWINVGNCPMGACNHQQGGREQERLPCQGHASFRIPNNS